MVYLVAVVYMSISLVQIRSMLKQKKKAEVAVYLALMLIALAYSYDSLLDLKLPNPGNLFMLMFDELSHRVFGNGH